MIYCAQGYEVMGPDASSTPSWDITKLV